MDFVTLIIIALVLSATSIVLSELLRPKPKFENARPAGLGDFQFPTATEGRAVPLVFGTVKVAGPNVIWTGDLTQNAVRKKVKTGLWSSKNITTGFKYYVGIDFAICRGPVTAIRDVYIGDVPIGEQTAVDGGTITIDREDLFGGEDMGGGGVSGSLVAYFGSETQSTDAYLVAKLGSTNLPAYRGTCHLVWQAGYIGTSTSIKPWGFEVEKLSNTLAIPSGKHIVNSKDMNPMEVLYELLTDTDWGLGYPTSMVDVAGFRVAAATLYDEGNGISLTWDSAREAQEMKREVERQINGISYLDMEAGMWKIQLTRADYDVDTIPQLVSGVGGNILNVGDFTRGTWEETTNQIRIQYHNRANQYQETFAGSTDLANQRIQNGRTISMSSTMPGVKDPTLAGQIAARTLRSLSTPLAKANVTVDRTLYDLHVGQAVAWTDDDRGFTKMAFRVTSVDYGSLVEPAVKLGLVQDVFGFQQGIFGDAPETLWTGSTQSVAAFPSDEQIAIEAPWALLRRDPDQPGVSGRVWCAGRRQTGAENSFQIFERDDPVSTSGAYTLVGEVFGFMLIGTLHSTITPGPASPQATIRLDPSPDIDADLQAAFEQSPSAIDIGQNLVNMIMVDNEFMAVTSTTDHTTYLDMNSVYRGMMDTAPADHTAGTPVYLVFVGAGLTDTALPQGNYVDIKLRPKSRTDEVSQGAAVTISFQMRHRCCRPYPPVEMALNTTSWASSTSIDTQLAATTDLDHRGVLAGFLRRDFYTFDEVQGLTTDASLLDPVFPTQNTTKYRAEVISDPLGTPVSLFTTDLDYATTGIFLSRTRILRYTAGVRPATLRVEVTANHDIEDENLDSLQVLGQTFTTTSSTIDDDHNFGVLANAAIGGPWTAPTTGTYNFTLGTAFTTGLVQASLNGAGYTTVITAGATTGTLAVTASDLVRIKHTQTGSNTAETFLQIDAPTTTADGYAVLTY